MKKENGVQIINVHLFSQKNKTKKDNNHTTTNAKTISKDKNNVELQYFTPQDIPIMVLKDKLGVEKARAFCNIHGLWEGYSA